MNDIYISLEQIGRLLRERHKLIIISSVIFTALYLYVVKYYGESFGIFYYKTFPIEVPYINPKPEYNFYSGGITGVYNCIGETLQENSNPEFQGFIDINNIRTSGGYENVLKVLGDSHGKAFGLVQEEAYNKDEMVRNELNYITPIYMERLYITYIQPNGKPDDEINQYQISSNTDKETLRFLAQKRIDIGSPNSGTHIISRYIINQLNSQIATYNLNLKSEERLDYIKDITNLGSTVTFESFSDHDTDVVLFMISGSPNRKFNDLLEETNNDHSVRLIGVEPDFTAQLNNLYDINLHFTSFNNKHLDYSGVTTIGTFAWLVTNNTTPPAHIREVLRVLNENKSSFASKLELPFVPITDEVKSTNFCQQNQIQSPLCEFDFLGHYNNKNEKVINSIWRNFMLFIISLIPSTVLFFHILSLLLSISKTDRYHDKLVELININIPENSLPSVFYFAKLIDEFCSNELTNKEYIYLKNTAVSQLMDAFKEEDDDKNYKRLVKRLKHAEIAKLIAAIMTSTRGKIQWDKYHSRVISYDKTSFNQLSKDNYQQNKILANEIKEQTIVSKLHPNPKSKVIRLLNELLSHPEMAQLHNRNYWEQQTKNTSIDQTYIFPFLIDEQSHVVNRIVEGISMIYELKVRISSDYTDGLLTEKHYNFLYNKTTYILERMQNILTIRLSGLMEREKNGFVTPELLKRYYISNYIERVDYYYLTNKLKGELHWEGTY
ncbi:MAG: TAXI family TRAP transporter solute-binding subunit [Saprospiraceae bacterium]|nr:TAXI family TRAP transporter solute-binding subunit [Saprospiraceae bacterium]